ncbi:MAG: hypothetical protein RJA22_761 [Verrucomicrobiota bacterium]|jgi:hypothetical protein
MNLKWFSSLALASLTLLVTGCVETVDGRHRAGLPFQRDRIEGRYERPAADVMAAAREVLRQQGNLTSEDNVRSSMQGVVEKANVWIAVEAIDKGVTRVIVQARKNGVADVELAAHLEKAIAVRLASGTR